MGRDLPNFCVICNSDKKRIDIHHIDKNKENFHIENLCKLCRNCHHKVHVLLRRGANCVEAVKNFFHLYSQIPISIRKRHKPLD